MKRQARSPPNDVTAAVQALTTPQTATALQIYTAGYLILETSRLDGTCIRTGRKISGSAILVSEATLTVADKEYADSRVVLRD
jgi:hypothetical protein